MKPVSNTDCHTPTPWKVREDSSGNKWPNEIVALDEGDCEVIRAKSFGKNAEEVEANAAFIVRACNAHEQLVSALRAIVSGWRDEGDGYYSVPVNACEAAEKVLREVGAK